MTQKSLYLNESIVWDFVYKILKKWGVARSPKIFFYREGSHVYDEKFVSEDFWFSMENQKSNMKSGPFFMFLGNFWNCHKTNAKYFFGGFSVYKDFWDIYLHQENTEKSFNLCFVCIQPWFVSSGMCYENKTQENSRKLKKTSRKPQENPKKTHKKPKKNTFSGQVQGFLGDV